MATQLPEGMADRIRNILLKPAEEWDRIDVEPMTTRDVYRRWVLPLAAVGPLAGLIGGQLFGYGGFGITFKPSLGSAFVSAILGYVFAIAGVWLLARIVDALAPNFGGVANPVAATKVVGFAWTAAFLAGVFAILPSLAFLSILGLYSLYLLYLGLPKLMKAPADRAMAYTAVTCLCAIVLAFVITALVTAITTRVVAPAFVGGGTVAGNLDVPGVGSVDVGKLEAASRQMAAAATQAQVAASQGTAVQGGVRPVDPAVLAALLPVTAAGWSRTTTESSAGSAGGIGGARAQGTYSQGANSATLSVTDLGAMGALAAMGGALNIQSDKTTATGYEKMGKADGRMTTEEWNTPDRRGKYSTVVADRFLVEIEGHAPGMNALKALAASVDLGKLAGMK